MKKNYLIPFLFLIFVSCYCQNNKYAYEDRIYDCFLKYNKEENIERKIKKIEKIIIQHKILENSSGKSYLLFFERLNEIDDFSLLISNKLRKDIKLIKNLPEKIICLDSTIHLDTIAAKNSRFYSLKEAWDELLSAGDINNELISYVALKHFNEEDFNHKLFKTILLLTLNKFIQNPDLLSGTNTGMQRKLPPVSDESSKPIEVKERNIMTVLVNQENEIFINNEKVKLEKINIIVKTFYLNPNNEHKLPEKKDVELPQIGIIKVSKGLISLQTDRNTGYEEYLQVQNELVRAINELRDDFGMKHFKASFEGLTVEEQDIVSKAFPLSISEAIPRGISKE